MKYELEISDSDNPNWTFKDSYIELPELISRIKDILENPRTKFITLNIKVSKVI